jgi:hypothetical protein
MGSRPVKFLDRLKIEDMVKKGLPSSQHLYLNAGAPINGVATLGLSDWMDVIQTDFSNKGLEGTCSIYDWVTHTDKSLFTDYGSISMEEVEKAAKDMLEDGVKYHHPSNPGVYVHMPVCPNHETNLCHATDIIKASIDTSLWTLVTDDIGPDPPGNVVLIAVAHAIQHMTA